MPMSFVVTCFASLVIYSTFFLTVGTNKSSLTSKECRSNHKTVWNNFHLKPFTWKKNSFQCFKSLFSSLNSCLIDDIEIFSALAQPFKVMAGTSRDESSSVCRRMIDVTHQINISHRYQLMSSNLPIGRWQPTGWKTASICWYQSDSNLFMKPRLHLYTRLYLPFSLQLLMTLKTRGQLLLPTDTPQILVQQISKTIFQIWKEAPKCNSWVILGEKSH